MKKMNRLMGYSAMWIFLSSFVFAVMADGIYTEVQPKVLRGQCASRVHRDKSSVMVNGVQGHTRINNLVASAGSNFSRSRCNKKLDSGLAGFLDAKRSIKVVNQLEDSMLDCEVLVADVEAAVKMLQESGCQIVSKSRRFKSIHAYVPAVRLSKIIENDSIIRIKRVVPPRHNKTNTTAGDIAHCAAAARQSYGFTGNGVKIGVISDSVRYLSNVQSSGDLPNNITVLPGMDGARYSGSQRTDSGEGTAMLEIVHDLCPGAQLFFATAGLGTEAELAEAVLALGEAGCDIIVDDICLVSEPAFQDGIVAQAVNEVSSAGCIYVTCAANKGNLASSCAAVWEGDFISAGSITIGGVEYEIHGFGSTGEDQFTYLNYWMVGSNSDWGSVITLQWSDAVGNSANDYDLALFDPDTGVFVQFAYDYQNGAGCNPYEELEIGSNGDGSFWEGSDHNSLALVILKQKNAQSRYLRLSCFDGSDKDYGNMFQHTTTGQIYGHNAAEAAISVAAAKQVTGRAFTSSDVADYYSSDGPRRVFYNALGSAYTTSLLSSGGKSLQKPDVMGAAGVSCATPGFNPFYGTSAAAPHIAAIVGLMLEASPDLTTDEVKDILVRSSFSSSGWTTASGYGAINAEEAVRLSQAAGASAITRPNNDNYANAASISGAAGSANGSNENATREVNEPYVYNQKGTNTVWWAWTAPATGVVVFDTKGSDFDTVMAAYAKASSVSSLGSKLDSNDDDDSQGGSYRQSKVAFDTASGSQYRIVVASYGTDYGSVKLNWQQYVKVSFNGNGATSGMMSVQTNKYDTATALPSCGFSRSDGYEFDGWTTSAGGSVVYAPGASPKFTSNTTLYAHWTPVSSGPENDNFANATRISGATGSTTGSNVGATYEAGEPLKDYKSVATNTVWWVWTAPSSGTATFSTTNTTFDTVMGVYTGTSVSSLTTIQRDDDGGPNYTSICAFDAVSGTTYYIAVSGYGAANQGVIKLYWSLVSLQTYTVTYKPGSYASGSTYAAVKTNNVALALRNATYSRTGYTQTAWSTSSAGTSRDYELGANYTANASLSLYPYWTANTYSVTYALNGGTHGTTHPSSATYDTAFCVSAPTKSGYTFSGWTVTSGLNTSTAKWGTTSTASTSLDSSAHKCANGATGNVYFKNLRSTTGSVTLTANWTCNHSGTTVQNARAATCTEVGYTGDTVCSTCGATIATGTTIPALGHNEGFGVVTKEPTATDEGVMTYSCTRCGIVMRTETIPKVAVTYPDLGFTAFMDWNFGYSMFTTTNSEGGGVFSSAPIRLFDRGEPFSVVYGYANLGEAEIVNATVKTLYEMISETGDMVVETSQDNLSLEPYWGSQSAMFATSWTNLVAGVYTARVTLDAENAIVETNRANNVREFVFAIRDPLALGTALGCSNLAFGTNGDDWYGTCDGSNQTVSYARTKHLGNYGTNVLSTTVTGAGTLSFDWKVSSEENYDWLEFLVDGVVTNRISGTNCVWQSCSYGLSGGNHVVEWRYRKDDSYYAGLDCAWLANVKWESAAIAPETVESPVVWADGADAVAEPVTFLGESCEISISCATEGAVIYYTTNGTTPRLSDRYKYTGPFAISDTTTIKAIAVQGDLKSEYVTATITKRTLTLAEAAGAGDLTFTTGGDAVWTPIFDVTATSGFSAQSGAIGDEAETWIQTSVSGSGTFSFQWKVDCELDDSGDATWDRVVVSTNGIEAVRMDGTGGWEYVTFVFADAGIHTIRWTFLKDDYNDEVFADRAWVSGVTWTPNASIPSVADDASAETVNAAVDSVGFADEGVKAAIGGSAAEYAAFRSWAGSVAGGEAAVVASSNAAISYMLGAERLFASAPAIEFGECEVVANTGEVMVSITVKDGEDAVAVASEKVKEMFEATSDLGDWSSTLKKLTPTVTDLTQGQSHSLHFKVRPGDGTSPRAFLRIRK